MTLNTRWRSSVDPHAFQMNSRSNDNVLTRDTDCTSCRRKLCLIKASLRAGSYSQKPFGRVWNHRGLCRLFLDRLGASSSIGSRSWLGWEGISVATFPDHDSLDMSSLWGLIGVSDVQFWPVSKNPSSPECIQFPEEHGHLHQLFSGSVAPRYVVWVLCF